MMHNDNTQKELREWFTELKYAKQELAEIDSIDDPVEKVMRRVYTKDRIARVEMNIDRIMRRL